LKIALLCHYFAPEPGAPQARLLETSRAWVRQGHEVTVVTGFPNHPTGILAPEDRGRLFREDEMDGIRVLRSWLYATPNRGFLRKILGHLSFMVTAVLIGGARARRPDVVIASSPTFFSVISAFVLSLYWRCPYVFEVRDLWPAIFSELGVLTNRRILGALEAVELFLYRHAARVVAVTDGFRDDIVSRGIPASKVVTITNGVDPELFAPQLGADAGSAEGRFTVLYLGAHGISHALGRILDVAASLADEPGIEFVFVGSGAEKPALVVRASREGLANVRFVDPVTKDEVPGWYRAADVGLVPLRDVPLFTTFIPSKMFEILACEVPVVASVAGEAAEIARRSGGAVVVGPEDVEGIRDAILTLRADPERRREMGRVGREFVCREYDRRVLAKRYARVLSEVTP
jgi:glycosyltransferase involved in cell wall biosynthesis